MNSATVLSFASNHIYGENLIDANRFLNHLYRQCAEGFVEVRQMSAEFEVTAHRWFRIGSIQIPGVPSDQNVYFGVATREQGQGTKQGILEIPAVWVDIDFKDIAREEAEKRLQNFQRKPSIIVESGKGLHVYWVLDIPATSEDIPKIEDINRRLADLLGGDPKSAEAARILRLPGTYNQKYNPPEPVTMTDANNNTYQLSDFDFLPLLPPSLPQALSQGTHSELYEDLLEGVSEGQRHDATVKLASRFSRSRMGVQEIQARIAQWNQKNRPPLEVEELYKTVRDVCQRYGHGGSSFKEVLEDTTDYGKVIAESVMSLSDFIRKQYPCRGYILKPLIRPGEIGMITAERGIGKTWLALGIALAATMKFPLARWESVTETGCLYIDGEMPSDLLQERVKDLLRGNYNAKPPLVFLSADDMRSKGQPAPRITSLGWRKSIQNYMKEHEGMGLLILDNLASLTPGADENTKRDWDDINQWLLELRAMGKAIIMIHHSGKGGRQRGTSSREDILDFSIRLKRPEGYCSDRGATFIVEFTKARSIYGADAKPFTLQLAQDSIGVNLDLVVEEESKKDAILALYKNGMRGKEIASTLNVSPSYVSQVLRADKSETPEAVTELAESGEISEPEEQEPFTVEPIQEDGEAKN